MSRVLVYTSPARGHLFPVTPILDELCQRGHQVALRTLSSQVERMRSHGIDAARISPAIEVIEFDDWRAHSLPGALRRTVRTLCARAEHDASDLRQAIEEERPESLLIDIGSWGALSAAEAWGGPWAAFCPYPLPLRSRKAPPFGPGWSPASGLLGRIRDRLAQPLFDAFFDRLVRPALNEIRGTLGLRSLDRAEELFLKPPLLLYMTAEPLEYQRPDWPPNVVMVGPCAWDPPASLPRELTGVREPFVLVTTSSEFQDDGRLVRAALDGLAEEPFHIVATLPSASIPELRAPPNATVVPFVPHTPILLRSACAITHGGMGATQKALAHRVPVCAVPFGRDQFEVARRLEVAGAGSRLAARRLRPDRLRQKVHEAVSCRVAATRIASSFAAAGGPVAAASAFELCTRSTAPHRDARTTR